MPFDRTKLKKVTIEDLEIGLDVYEDKNGLIKYYIDKTFNKQLNNISIPLVVINDPNGFFKINSLVYRSINNLLYIAK